MADINGIDFFGAVLEQIIGESASGSADIRSDDICYFDAEFFDGVLKFLGAAADIIFGRKDFNLCVG